MSKSEGDNMKSLFELEKITFEKVKLVTRDTLIGLAVGGIFGFGTALLLLLLK